MLLPGSAGLAGVPGPAGYRRRRHGAGVAIDPRRLLPAGEARPGLALFGVAVVVAPVVGPTLGGWLADNVSWHWCFLINGPVGAVRRRVDCRAAARDAGAGRGAAALQQQGRGFDVIGFALVATFLGALEVLLRPRPRGRLVRLELHRRGGDRLRRGIPAHDPVGDAPSATRSIDLRMVASRQFGACFLVMLATGAILLATTQFLPQLVQQDLGYTATWAGLVLSPGGLVTMAMMFVTGRLLTADPAEVPDRCGGHSLRCRCTS